MVFEHYRQTVGSFPQPGYVGSATGLSSSLSNYHSLFQSEDGWRQPFLYLCSHDGQHYTLISAGSDVRFEYGAESNSGLGHKVDWVVEDGEWVSFYPGWAGWDKITLDAEFLDKIKAMGSSGK